MCRRELGSRRATDEHQECRSTSVTGVSERWEEAERLEDAHQMMQAELGVRKRNGVSIEAS